MKTILITVVLAACAALGGAAMPTKEESERAEPLVRKLMAPERAALESGKKRRAEVAAAAMKLADEADTEAAKLLLMKGAFVLYVKDGNLEKAVETMNALEKAIADVPPQCVTNMIETALLGLSKKEDGVRLYWLFDEARMGMSADSLEKTKEIVPRPQRPNGLKDIDRKNLPKLWSAPGVKEHVLKLGDGADDLVFVECPAGDFMMGFREEKGKGDAFYRHRVTLTYPFWMLKTQLTRGQSYVPGICEDGKGSRQARSAWDHNRIAAFLAFLNQKFAAQIPKGYVIRFPTFAEYQYAYRANATDPNDPYTHDQFSGDDSKRICFDNGSRKGWLGIRRTWTRVWPAEVGLLEPNAWGLYDMVGNGYTYLCDRMNGELPVSSHYRYADHETDPIVYEEDADRVLMRSGNGPLDMPNWFFNPWRWAFTYRLVVGPDLERKGRAHAAEENLRRHDAFYHDMFAQLPGRKTGPSRVEKVTDMELTAGQSMRFVTCPAGTFTMGHDFSKGPFYRHEVTISRPFMMAEERLTMGTWFAYLEAIGKPIPEEKRLSARKRGGDRSALCGISGEEWAGFIAWLNGKFAKEIPKGYVFRLPTEAEWEYAYRAGSNRKDDPFAWSVPFVGNQAYAAKPYAYTEDERRADYIRYGKGVIADTVWSAYTTDWRRMTLVDPGVVGTKKPNAWGFKDMIGNGREWVMDRFDSPGGQFPSDLYCQESVVTDPLFGFELDKWACQMSRGGDDGYAGRKCWDIMDGWYPSELFCYRLVIGPDLITEKRAEKNAQASERRQATVGGYTWSYRVNNGEATIVSEKDGKYSCAVSPNPTGHVTIPSMLGDAKVTSIGQGAFIHCGELTSLTMCGERPNVHHTAFQDCGKLKAIHVPAKAKSWTGMKEWQGIPLVFGAKEDGESAVDAGLAVHFKFDGDLVENVSRTAWKANKAVSYCADHRGRPDAAIVFDGNTKLSCPLEINISNEMTIAAWVKPQGRIDGFVQQGERGDNRRRIVGPAFIAPVGNHGDRVHADQGIIVGTNGVMLVEHGACHLPVTLAYKKDLQQQWHHVAMVICFQKPSVLYVDGVEVARGIVSTRVPTLLFTPVPKFAQEPILGGNVYRMSPFEGCVSDLTVYRRALTAQEIAQTVLGTESDAVNSSVGHVHAQAAKDRTTVQGIIDGMIKVPGRDYWLSETELTQGQWEAVMGYNLSTNKGVNLPAGCVSRDDCDVFVEKLNLMEEVRSSQFEFALPTSDEWAYAARAGGYERKWWIRPGVVGDFLEMAWLKENSGGQTHAVATKAPNAFGFYDMKGNVWEWMNERDKNRKGHRLGGSYVDTVDEAHGGWYTPCVRRYETCGLRLAAHIRPRSPLGGLRRPGLANGGLLRKANRPQATNTTSSVVVQAEGSTEKAQREAERAEQRQQL